MSARYNNARRGVLLLIVLGFLAMFGLIAITFVLLTGHHERSAEIAERIEQHPVRPETLLDEGLSQALNGTTARTSALQIHGLFEDMYGNGWLEGRVAAARTVAAGQLVEIGGQMLNAGAWVALPTPQEYVGRVITLTSGSAAGQSTRIVGYSNGRLQIQALDWPSAYGRDGQPGRAGVDDDGSGTTDDDTETGWSNSDDYIHQYDRFVINGADFAGTGIGYNPATGMLNAAHTSTNFGDWPHALLPNPAFWPYLPNSAGANEDYDAVDFQNMLLAMMAPDGTVPIPSLHRPELINYWFNVMAASPALSSLSADEQWLVMLQPYGPDCIPGNADDGGAPWSSVPIGIRNEIVALKRKMILRPLPEDNPSFNGSNLASRWIPPAGSRATNYWERTGPLDVDNNGDGIPDGIWVDLGLPVRSAPDGRLYRPLFSFLCLDLDGRLNVNAHGSLAQAAAAYYSAIASPDRAGNPALRPTFASVAISAALPRGQGFGPADINLGPLFGDGDLANSTTGPALLTNYQNLLTQRFGPDNVPGTAGDDALSQNISYQYWNECWREGTQFLGLPAAWNYDFWKYYYDPANYVRCGYGSPFDVRGDGAVGIDLRGAPVYPQMNDATDHTDDPYEMDLFHRVADRPYTAADLERILRRYDHDSGRLPTRLTPFLTYSGHTTDVTTEMTTDSYHVPTPGAMLTPALRTQISTHWGSLSAATQTELRTNVSQSLGPNKPNPDITDLLIVRLARGLQDGGTTSANIPGRIAALLPRLLPTELRMGLRMDLNRAFGNGIDDNTNWVVDEPAHVVRNPSGPPEFTVAPGYPGELVLPAPKGNERMPQVDSSGAAVTAANMVHANGVDVNGDGTVDSVDHALVRQLYARQLYVLMLLVSQPEHTVASPSAPTPSELSRARFAAQWAVNVVDFRDRDSIMTPFEYDISPFTDEDADGDTWDVDGVLDVDPSIGASDDDEAWRALAWGCERPELLITETLAFHDRAVQNLDTEAPAPGKKYDPTDPTNSDEDFDSQIRPKGALYVELYNPWTWQEPSPGELYDAAARGVALNRMTGPSPVWRLSILDDQTDNPDDPTVIPERTVYFVDATGINVTDNGVAHFPSVIPAAPIMPGRYTVIGPGDLDQPGYTTTAFIGLSTTAPKGDTSCRRITLTRNNDPNVDGQVEVERNRDATDSDQDRLRPPVVADSRIQPAVAVVVDRAIAPSWEAPGTTGPRDRRLSISEPDKGYPVSDPDGVAYDQTNQQYTRPYDEPLDWQADATIYDTILRLNGTHVGYRVIHLQRLANPAIPWDARTNPYRTIDSMMVDLTTFNGANPVNPVPDGAGGSLPNDQDEPGEADAPFTDGFYSRERGENSPVPGQNNLWTRERLGDSTTPPDDPKANGADFTAASQVFSDGLHHTLGYLNWDLGGEGVGGPRDGSTGALHRGDPLDTPFPWMAWNNRPFVSPLELLQVPAVDARELLRHPTDVGPVDQYPFGRTFGVIPAAATPDPYARANEQFTHLLNFLLAAQDVVSTPPLASVPHSLYQLFDLVDVPSPFVGSQLQANPTVFATSGGHVFAPPSNRIPTYREPGLLNINTIFSPNVWRGLINYFPDMTTAPGTPAYFDDMWLSRRGYAAAGLYDINNNYPTRFVNPFRSAGSAHLVPPLATAAVLGPPPAGAPPAQRAIDATLLRVSPTAGATEPLFGYSSAANINNTDRNPAFRYQTIQRLGNLVTTRSNVYAMWITMGFFEVQPWGAVDAAHPDGYCLGQELGTDSGEVERHRAFSIVDRSIPVGFIRGRDLNSDKAVLIKRYIE